MATLISICLLSDIFHISTTYTGRYLTFLYWMFLQHRSCLGKRWFMSTASWNIIWSSGVERCSHVFFQTDLPFKGHQNHQNHRNQLFGTVMFNHNTSLPNCMCMFLSAFFFSPRNSFFRNISFSGHFPEMCSQGSPFLDHYFLWYPYEGYFLPIVVATGGLVIRHSSR